MARGKGRETYDRGFRSLMRRRIKSSGHQMSLGGYSGGVNVAVQHGMSLPVLLTILSQINPALVPLYFLYQNKELLQLLLAIATDSMTASVNQKHQDLQSVMTQSATDALINLAAGEEAIVINRILKKRGVYDYIAEKVNPEDSNFLTSENLERIFMAVTPSVLRNVNQTILEAS